MRNTAPEYGPNWFTSVMGTGIVAVAITGLPFDLPGGHVVAVAFWLAAVGLLAAVCTVMIRRLRDDAVLPLRHLDDPVLAHFYGAPPMAILTVGASTMTAGPTIIGPDAATIVGAACWILGTALGLLSAVAIPYRMITSHTVADDAASGGWLVSVVPPMVSAATGAALVKHLPEGQFQETMLLACYGLFGLTAVAGFLMLNQLWHRIIRHGLPAAGSVPVSLCCPWRRRSWRRPAPRSRSGRCVAACAAPPGPDISRRQASARHSTSWTILRPSGRRRACRKISAAATRPRCRGMWWRGMCRWRRCGGSWPSGPPSSASPCRACP